MAQRRKRIQASGPARTIHPLHFEDLEPHRFEDLVRQLAYGLRAWHSIEAIGRLGADKGLDIRAIERVAEPAQLPDSLDAEQEPQPFRERVWAIQCKRVRRLSPSHVKGIIADSLPDGGMSPDVFVLAAACDFSLASREAFRKELLKMGVAETLIWGKGELEDQLFRPENDHLLFAYFGFSLQVRRRSQAAGLNGRIALKRRLTKFLGELRAPSTQAVLLRDVDATEYPRIVNPRAFLADPRWRYYEFAGHQPIDHVAFVMHKYWAWARFSAREYDSMETLDQGMPSHPSLHGVPQMDRSEREKTETFRRFWTARVPRSDRAWLVCYGFIAYDRIVAVDDIGDIHHPGVHLIVDCRGIEGFFDGKVYRVTSDDRYSGVSLPPDQLRRVKLFPDDIPVVPDEEFFAAV